MRALLNDIDDVAWLRSTVLRRFDPPKFASFELEGSEDWPDKISIYQNRNPSVFETALRVYQRADNGTLVEAFRKAQQ